MRSAFLSSVRLASILILAPLSAQQLALQGPTSGLIYDETRRAIRPILGIPGGAHLSVPIFTDLDYASIAPNGQTALGVRNGRVLVIRGLTSRQTTVDALVGAIVNPDRILWSENSTTAVLCSDGRLQRVTNLDNTPATEGIVGFPSLKGRITTIAVDPSGRKIVAGIRGQSGGAVFFISEYGDISQLTSMEEPSAAVFTQDGQDIYVADRASEQVWLFRNASAQAPATLMLDTSNGISDPVGLAVAGQRLFVVNGTKQAVRTYDLPSVTFAGEYLLDTAPRGIERIGGSYYRVTVASSARSELWLLDVRSQQPSIFFVPSGE
jgi:hypothetical protein